MKKFVTIAATALAAAIALTGCASGTGTGSGMSGMSGGSSSASAAATPSTAGAHNSADTTFAQMMVPHHTQAVDMSNTILNKQGIDPRVSALAEKVKAEQGPEIEKMTAWLSAWKEAAPMTGMSGMTGMMSADDMKKLEAAQGTVAAKLFLSQMVMHHEGAVAMAQTEASNGKNADAVALANSIVTSQQSEIKDMKDLQAAL